MKHLPLICLIIQAMALAVSGHHEVCKTTKCQCKLDGGECQTFAKECEGKILRGKVYCSNSKHCGCCVSTIVLPTPQPVLPEAASQCIGDSNVTAILAAVAPSVTDILAAEAASVTAITATIDEGNNVTSNLIDKLEVVLQSVKQNLDDLVARLDQTTPAPSTCHNTTCAPCPTPDQTTSAHATCAPCPTTDMVEVSFASSEGIAKASSYYSNGFAPNLAFIRGDSPWCTASGTSLPQSLWFEFLNPIILLIFSFTTREDVNIDRDIECGASKYNFWGSNNANCDDASNRVILFEDYSGIPFTRYNDPKMAYIRNKNPYKCYGFTIQDIPLAAKDPACIDNVRFYAKPDRR